MNLSMNSAHPNQQASLDFITKASSRTGEFHWICTITGMTCCSELNYGPKLIFTFKFSKGTEKTESFFLKGDVFVPLILDTY